MQIASALLNNLRSNLTSLLAGCHSESQLNQIIAISHCLAVAYIGRRISNGSFNRSLIPFDPEDIAYDCIAELYERDSTGAFIQLQAYFDGVHIADESDQSLLIHMRRLTFSKVNHGIFRIYNEADPALGKIVRNIKGAVGTLNNFHETEHFGELHLTPTGCDPLRHLPAMEHGFFEEQFSRDVYVLRHVPALLARLSLFLRSQHDYRRSVSLMSAALVFRNIFARQELASMEEPSVDTSMLLEDARNLIRNACAETMRSLSVRYVGGKKVDADVFAAYFEVIEAHLVQTIVEKDGHDFSFFNALRTRMPGMTKHAYHEHHKSIIEYAARLARERTFILFKEG